MKRPSFLLTALAAGLLSVGMAGAAGALTMPQWLRSGPPASNAHAAPAVNTAEAVPFVDGQGVVPDYRAIVKRFGPAVVGVQVSGVHAVSLEEGGGDPFLQFFRGVPGRGQGALQKPFQGQGSGFVISEDGLILTNAHVVRDAKEVMVHLADRREFAAQVLGADPVTDVAVLRIAATGLTPVLLGNPADVEVGDRVLAIGAPYGLEQTATQGIVSAKGRSLPGDSVVPFLQTDAAVNPGNSGGPLFDGHGRVVGINAQIYTESGGFQGLSFAIPLDVALQVKDQIVATGKAVHARLGVSVQNLSQPLAESFGLSRPDGALVSQVERGSAAARSGLRPGDVITQVDGQPVVQSGQLSSRIALAKPGDSVHLTVWRDAAEQRLTVQLGGREAPPAADPAQASAPAQGPLGLALRPLTAQELAEADGVQGLMVMGVAGVAEKAGIAVGDVLLAVNGKPLESVDTLRRQLKSKPKTLALLVQRDHQPIFVPLKLS